MSIWNDLKLLWNHHISNWKVSHINFFLSWNMEEKLPEDGFWHEISSVPSHSSSAESSWASLLQRPQGRGSAHGLHISAYISSSAEPYFNHLSPAEFLSYKHANLRHHWEAQSFKRTCIIYSFFRDLFRSKQPQKGKRLTVFPTETFNNFNKVIVELRRPPQTRELRFVVLPYSSSLRILHFRLMKNGEAHKRWYG